MRSKLSLRRLDDRIVPAAINFNLTTATSSLALSGTVAGVNISAQGTGSLTTTYTGSVQLDFDPAAGTIAFVSAGTSATANISGNWQPQVGGASGTAPANYGGKLVQIITVATFAARDAVYTIDSTPLALSGAGSAKTYPSTQSFHLTAGSIDYNQTFPTTAMGSVGFDQTPVTNTAAAGTFTDNGNGTYSLVIPISTTVTQDLGSGNSAVINTKGTLNATAILPVVDLNGAGAGNDVTFLDAAGTPAFIAPAATITRTPSANLTGMNVTLVNPPNGANEALDVDLTGTGLSTSGYNPFTGLLEITGSGSLATYQSVLQKVKYNNAGLPATAGPRTITVTVNDGTNDSLPRTATGDITLPAVNSKVQSLTIGDGTVQRSMIPSLTVAFDGVVTFVGNPANAFSLPGITVSADTVSLSTPTQTVAKLSFSGGNIVGNSLPDGLYNLTVLASVAGSDGVQNLDGDGNGTAGDNYVSASFRRKFGDADGDGDVDNTDFTAFRLAFGNGASAIFDSDGDGDVDNADFTAFRNRFGT